MSAPVFPQKALLTIAMRGRLEDRPLEAESIETAVEMYLAAAAQVTISQNATTIAQLAHEWAKARRARFTLPRVAFAECEHSTLDEYERERGQCFDNTLTPGHYALEEKLAAMCEPCRAATIAMLDKRRASAKLVGLSARLERACLGPREKKGASDV